MLGHHGRAGTGQVAAVAVLLACVLLTAVGVAALRTDTASADTVLQRGADAVLELSDGTTRPAVEGERVPRGATVRAGRTGAVLQTREREVHLGADTAVTVLDGLRQELEGGFVMVDASDAPGLQLTTAAGAVTAADDSLVRVDGGALVRVGVLRGAAAAVRAAGRRATSEIPTYYQVQVPTGGLPGAVTPFVLSPDDAYERRLAADLVAADEALEALASRLEQGPAARVVLATSREQVAAPVEGSEGAIGFLIATAASEGDSLPARYDRVRDLRRQGGSWGIVAAIVSADVDRVGAALNALLEPGTVPVVAGAQLDVDAALGLGDSDTSGPGSPQDPSGPQGPSTDDGDGDAPDRDNGGNGGNGGGPSPTPSPTPGPADPVIDVVEDVVDTVLDLVSPSPSALPLPVRVPALPSPTPLVQVQVETAPLLK